MDLGYTSIHETTSKSFITPLYHMIFAEDVPCMSKRGKEIITKVADWFPISEATFIMVFGSYKPPNALPTLVMNIIPL